MRSPRARTAEASAPLLMPALTRRLPVGAEPVPGEGVHFRVWAPASSSCVIELGGAAGETIGTAKLGAEKDGYFSGLVPQAHPGSLYRFRLDDEAFPDPVSRFQPHGPSGPSVVVDPTTFAWTDTRWTGRPPTEWVIYELHLGSFTPEGTWEAARHRLPQLADLGITVIEVMPVAEFPGRFGWGYDGVDLFAPYHRYGEPDSARAFVDAAHALGLMVILDVVYNHVGPDGSYLRQFSPDYFSTRYANEWGDPMNFDDANSAPVREFFVSNARLWIEEYHFDGLRLDATQQIFDRSPRHILAEIADTLRAGAPHRRLCLIGENECQHARLARPTAAGGCGLDALWNDDFHHSAMVAATGRAEAYYAGYRGSAQEFVSGLKRGFLYQGQWYGWQQQRRGKPAFDLPRTAFVAYLQNHDQVANSAHGLRLHALAGAGDVRALTALLLLGPAVPLLFQGQEFGATTPFLYFADHTPELASKVRQGRAAFLRQFPSIDSAAVASALAAPEQEATFNRCKLDLEERQRHTTAIALHRDLLRLRASDPTLRLAVAIDGAVLAGSAFVIRFFAATGDDRLLLVNLGNDLRLEPAPEPLLAPPEDRSWALAWTSESPVYGGGGQPPVETADGWMLPAHSAILMQPDEPRELPRARLAAGH